MRSNSKRVPKEPATTHYKWDMGWNVINEENGAGTLQRTYVGHTMAHVDGTDPAYGTWAYYFHDHLGSTRRLRDASKTSVAAYEFMPYGQVYAASGTTTATTHTYAMLAWDDTASMYFAPFRYYMPQAGRWTQRDPLGMVDGPNVYGYVGGRPNALTDHLGRSFTYEFETDPSFDPVWITYTLDVDMKCDKIRLNQVAQTDQNWIWNDSWHIDEQFWYPHQMGNSSAVTMNDDPSCGWIGGTQEFVVTAYCCTKICDGPYKGWERCRALDAFYWRAETAYGGAVTFFFGPDGDGPYTQSPPGGSRG